MRMSAPPVLGDRTLSIRLPVTLTHNTFPEALTTPESSFYIMILDLTLSPERGNLFYFIS